MALTINPEISGQVITSACSYCYLFEPLRVSISESETTAEKIYVDLEIIDTTDDTNIVATEVEYGVFDTYSGNVLSIDLMEIARQYHDSKVYIYSSIDDITDTTKGWHSVVSKYKYNFKIYSDVTATQTEICKLPIIGGRLFKDFSPGVDQTQSLTRADELGVDLSGRWDEFPFITQTLADPTATDSRPTITNTTQTTGSHPCGGFIIFKSMKGGWSTWGLEIKVERESGSYSGNLQVGMFESTEQSNGNAYIPIDYTEINSSYSIELKSLGLLNIELDALSDIHHSPALYYMADKDSSLELMRKASADTPKSNISNGGDFSLSLSSISSMTQKTR